MKQQNENQQDTDMHLLDKLSVGDVSSRLNVYEYIWLKVFPNEELNYNDFYDWSRENANRALELALEYCDLNGS
jgi:hypothetical protein